MTFLKTPRGNEAIEIGLWHANQEENLSQVILIGDAAPNTKEEVIAKRNKFSNFWNVSTKFNPPTFYLNELIHLKTKNIPVHAFYIVENARKSFEEIASFTNGNSELLDIYAETGSEILTNLVNIEILRNIGGSQRGNDLVKAYKTMYNVF